MTPHTDVASNLRALGKLKREVEKAKRTLSTQQNVRLEIESFEGGNDFSETLTRAKFEEINIDLFRKPSSKPSMSRWPPAICSAAEIM